MCYATIFKRMLAHYVSFSGSRAMVLDIFFFFCYQGVKSKSPIAKMTENNIFESMTNRFV